MFGGLYNPDIDRSYSITIKRTMREQLGNNFEIGKTKFLFDEQLDHWAYSSSSEKMHANFFICQCAWGYVRPNSDFELVEWVTLKEFEEKKFVFEFELFKENFIESLKEFI